MYFREADIAKSLLLSTPASPTSIEEIVQLITKYQNTNGLIYYNKPHTVKLSIMILYNPPSPKHMHMVSRVVSTYT